MNESGMPACDHCGGPVASRRLARYLEPPIGLDGVVLEDTAIETYCAHCGTVRGVTIPSLTELIAAAAVMRVTLPFKLNGREIRFLRHALEWTGRTLARRLEVQPETVSRWESGDLTIAPANEKLLRLTVGDRLSKHAPGIPFDSDRVASLDLRGARSSETHLEMVFRFARRPCVVRTGGRRLNAWQGEPRGAVA